MSLLPVEGQPGLYRDTKSNAIVNSNTVEYENYLKQRNSRQIKNEKIEELESEMHQIKNDLFEIKSLLKSFIEK
tara:strand:+ start:249 stop:470 length:222 start_codon:yes stop_codon:yes gene_type:complete